MEGLKTLTISTDNSNKPLPPFPKSLETLKILAYDFSIEFPKGLKHLIMLYCGSELLEFPEGLETLEIENDKIQRLFSFPTTLKILKLKMPKLTSLPPLPKTLEKLTIESLCFNQPFSMLPLSLRYLQLPRSYSQPLPNSFEL